MYFYFNTRSTWQPNLRQDYKSEWSGSIYEHCPKILMYCPLIYINADKSFTIFYRPFGSEQKHGPYINTFLNFQYTFKRTFLKKTVAHGMDKKKRKKTTRKPIEHEVYDIEKKTKQHQPHRQLRDNLRCSGRKCYFFGSIWTHHRN